MLEATNKSMEVIGNAEAAPGWTHYTCAVDAILEGSADECDLLAERVERSIDKIKYQREKLIQAIGKIHALVSRYGLKRINVCPDDPIGMVACEIEKAINGILSVFESSNPSIELLSKATPSDKSVRSIQNKLDVAHGQLDEIKNRLNSICVEFPAHLNQIMQNLQLIDRQDGGASLQWFRQCLDSVQHQLLSSQESDKEMTFSQLLLVVGNEGFQALKASLHAAQVEYDQIKNEEESLRKQKEIDKELIEADRKSISELLSPSHYALPLIALIASISLLFCVRNWSSFHVSMTTLAISVVLGLFGVWGTISESLKKGDLPKSFSEDESLVAFGFGLPLLVASLQFVGAIIMAIVTLIFSPKLHFLVKTVLPLESWSQFFGFIVLGPLACIAAGLSTVATYYLALIKPMRHRLKTGPPALRLKT